MNEIEVDAKVDHDDAKARLVVESIAPPFVQDGPYGWWAKLPRRLSGESNDASNPKRSSLWVLEQGAPIGPAHSQHDDIRSKGGGRYSHWNGALFFSTSDLSDPNTNKRDYSVGREFRRPTPEVSSAYGSGVAIELLADLVKRRGVCEIAYFHTDHFEPWFGATERDEWWKSLGRFGDLTKQSHLASKLTLFYKPRINYRAKSFWRLQDHRLPRDGVGFFGEPQAFYTRCQDTLAPLEREYGHEFQLHVHHEGWTMSDFTHPDIVGWMKRKGSSARDSARLNLFLQLCKQVIRKEIGRNLDEWAFVHGSWALNASNPRFCCIVDELAILQRNGCYGDFTFPAGELVSDPTRIEAPFTCATPALAKSYDCVEGDLRPLSRGGGDLQSGRFFVWNSPIKGQKSSLDYYLEDNVISFSQPEFLLRDWLSQSVIIDDCLYIKTHAHSMHEKYRLWESDSVIPHAHPLVRRIFDLLQKVSDRARVPVCTLTVSQLMKRLRAFDCGC